MVVTIAQLDCLDLLIWLRLGSEVRKRVGFAPSSISRALQRVSGAFGVSVVKHDGEWYVLGDDKLLNMERMVHQKNRWVADLPLRLESQYFSASLLRDFLPRDWIKGNLDYMEVGAPLQHLRNGVIDAWIGFFPDVPAKNDQDLCCVDLIKLPVHLVVAAKHPLVALGDGVTITDVKCHPSLALPDNAFPYFQARMQELGLWNLPMLLKRHNYDKWERQVTESGIIGYATPSMINLFDSSRILLPIHIPLEVGETLVVRREYATHPRFEGLVSDLKSRAVKLQQRFLDVRLCF